MSYIARIPMRLRLYSNSQWKQIRKVSCEEQSKNKVKQLCELSGNYQTCKVGGKPTDLPKKYCRNSSAYDILADWSGNYK